MAAGDPDATVSSPASVDLAGDLDDARPVGEHDATADPRARVEHRLFDRADHPRLGRYVVILMELVKGMTLAGGGSELQREGDAVAGVVAAGGVAVAVGGGGRQSIGNMNAD